LEEKPKEVRIYWSGGASHFEDWAMINKPLKRILEKNDNVKLVILGQTFSGTLKELPKEKVEIHKWVHYEAYPYKKIFMQPTFGIIPLEDTAFSRGKSPIKWIELGALGIPSVTSYTPPYDIVYSEGAGIFVKENDPDLWVQGMQMLIDDPLLRAKMGHEARQEVLANYDIKLQWYRWKNAFEEILK
jgi:glycosyltransferase involved in cell wall biosynthesis